jgi:hypothetical protein
MRFQSQSQCTVHVLLVQETEDDFSLVFAQLRSVLHQLACASIHDDQRDTNISGLLKVVSALTTGLPGFALVLAMLRKILVDG